MNPASTSSTDLRDGDIRQPTDVGSYDRASDIEARFAWARQQGHASYLWPDVAPAAWRACLREIERTVAGVLAGERRVDVIVPAEASARAFGVAAFTSGTGPLLGYWCETDRVGASPDVIEILRNHLAHGRARSAKMSAALSGVLDLLSGAGIAATVLKASHTSLAYFPEPGTRPAADIDVVVGEDGMEDAGAVLRSAGYLALKTMRRPRKSDWLPPGQSRSLRSVDFTHADNPFTIELHATADRSFFGVRDVRFGPLDHRNTRPAPEIHPSARVLVQPWLTTYLAAHASEELHQLQLVRIIELVEVIRRDREAGRFDDHELAAFVEWLGVTRFVAPALVLAERLAPGCIAEPLANVVVGAMPPRMRRVLDSVGPGTAQRLDGISLDERLVWVKGPLDMTRRLLHMLWPTRGEDRRLEHVYRERLARLLRGRVSLRSDR